MVHILRERQTKKAPYGHFDAGLPLAVLVNPQNLPPDAICGGAERDPDMRDHAWTLNFTEFPFGLWGNNDPVGVSSRSVIARFAACAIVSQAGQRRSSKTMLD